MNMVTIFGDIHGNLPALEAVLSDIDQRGLAPLYCLGDLVGYGTFPNEVISAIRERNIPTLMGNYDQGVGFSEQIETLVQLPQSSGAGLINQPSWCGNEVFGIFDLDWGDRAPSWALRHPP